MSQAQRFVPPPALRTRLGAMYAEPHRLLGDRECERAKTVEQRPFFIFDVMGESNGATEVAKPAAWRQEG
jgi:hypothetical protein